MYTIRNIHNLIFNIFFNKELKYYCCIDTIVNNKNKKKIPIIFVIFVSTEIRKIKYSKSDRIKFYRTFIIMVTKNMCSYKLLYLHITGLMFPHFLTVLFKHIPR